MKDGGKLNLTGLLLRILIENREFCTSITAAEF